MLGAPCRGRVTGQAGFPITLLYAPGLQMIRSLLAVGPLLLGVAILLTGQGLQSTLLPMRATLESFSPIAVGASLPGAPSSRGPSGTTKSQSTASSSCIPSAS